MNNLTPTAFKLILAYMVVLLFFFACKQKTYKLDPPDSPFKKSLVEKKIEGSGYSISLPLNYLIKENRGPDFSVYYFFPADTANKTSFYGGFYLGNAPGGFDVGKEEKLRSYLLGSPKEWAVY